MSRDYCTLFLDGIGHFKWGDKACKEHDAAYARQDNKFKADLRFAWALCSNMLIAAAAAIFLAVTLIPAYLFVSTVGWYYYVKAGKK